MRAVLADAPGHLVVSDAPCPEPGDRALVAVESAGLCGTDLKILSGHVPIRYPRILGHEVVGAVVRSGPRSHIPVGTRVLIDPLAPCGQCPACLSDRAHLCYEGGLMGRDIDGGFAEYVVVGEERLHPVPSTVSPSAAPLLQVAGTCIHGQRRCQALPGQVAAIIGLGVAGLLHLQLLRARGVDDVVGVSRSPWKRDLARDLGARAAVSPDDAAGTLRELGSGDGADVVVDAAGTVASLCQAIHLVAPGGSVLAFGVITEKEATEFPFYDLYYKEVTVTGSRAALPPDYAQAIQMAASGQLDLAPLVSRSYPLDEAALAFDLAGSSSKQALKVTLDVAGAG